MAAYHPGMEISRHRAVAVLAALVVALLGLMALQSVLLDGVRRQKDRAFDQAARTALAQVTTRLDAGEVVQQIRLAATPLDSVIVLDDAHVFHFGSDRRAVVADVISDEPLWPERLPELRTDGRTGRDSVLAAWFTVRADSVATGRIDRLLSNLGQQQARPVTERVDLDSLDSLLPAELRAAGLEVAVEYGIMVAGTDSLVIVRGGANPARLAMSSYRTRLFPSAFFGPHYELVADFPGRAAWTWRQVAPLLVGSVVFTVLVIVCTVYGVRTILAQRRFAAELVTFVDNLTHELKTPLATMALASEAMVRPDVQTDGVTLTRYSGMIADEVRRLREHVDRILQLAHLERGDLALEREPVDVHEVLGPVLEGFALRVTERGGELATQLAAAPSLVNADPVHLAGMVANLLDNAVKYSPDAPAVSVSTRAEADRLIIAVNDRGVGVPAGDRQRVFQRYYRCQRGDRHDVKGFGLGLNYVHHMVALHGGDVSLEGRDGGGTCVALSLPLLAEDVP